MRTKTLSLAILALLPAIPSCGTGQEGDAGSAVPEKAAKAARIADEIAASPDEAEAILQRNGMTRADFETLMYEIAEDEALSLAYEKARKR